MALSEFDAVVKAVLHGTPITTVVKPGATKPGITITQQPPSKPVASPSYNTYLWVHTSSTTGSYFKY